MVPCSHNDVNNFRQPNYVPTLEDEIEAERQLKVAELLKSGKGTPVTPESFAAWMERKQKKRQAEAKKAVETELRKKKGGKGLSVLSGRDLYNFKKDLFEVEGLAAAEDDENGNGVATAAAAGIATVVEEDTADITEGVATMVQSDLFLECADDDLDDLDDD